MIFIIDFPYLFYLNMKNTKTFYYKFKNFYQRQNTEIDIRLLC
jgi:hypothetical protein